MAVNPPSATLSRDEIERFRRGDILLSDEQANRFCDLALSALSETPRSHCWLIERGQAVGHSPTVWFKGDFANNLWTEVAHEARRFESKAAAEQEADRLFGRFTGDGLRRCAATEHVFLDDASTTRRFDKVVDGAKREADRRAFQAAITDEDVEKALEAANGAMVDTRRYWTAEDRAAVRAMLEAVSDPSATPCSGWVSVQERLPESHGDVLVAHPTYSQSSAEMYGISIRPASVVRLWMSDKSDTSMSGAYWQNLPKGPA